MDMENILHLLGAIVLVVCFLSAWRLVHSKDAPARKMLIFGSVGIVVGYILLQSERVTEISMGLAKIKSKAISEAEEISRYKEESMWNAASLDSLYKMFISQGLFNDSITTQTRALSKELENAGEKTALIDASLIQARKALQNLDEAIEFMMIVMKASNNDRHAFDRLWDLCEDKSYIFCDEAVQTWRRIMSEYDVVIPITYDCPFPDSIKAKISNTTLDALKSIYWEMRPFSRPWLIQHINERGDIARKEKMQFLADILQNESGLSEVAVAGRFFRVYSGQEKVNSIASRIFLSWWSQHKDSLQ